jgi:hypothetical protein
VTGYKLSGTGDQDFSEKSGNAFDGRIQRPFNTGYQTVRHALNLKDLYFE